MAFDILKFYNDHKGFYGDMPLEDVAKDAYNRGFNNGEADYDTWKQSAGIGSILEEDRKRRNPTFEDKLRSQVEQKPAESNILKSFVQGAAEGVTTEIPSMVGGALEFTGSHLPFKGIERAGKTIKDWAEEKRQELYGPEIERTGLDRIVYEGTKMLAPSLIPGFVVGTGARALKGVNALAKAGKMAEATAAAESATNIAAGSVAGLFGLSQAQQTKDTAEKEGVAPGLAPYATGIIEATGEFLGTKYLAKLFRLDEAEAFKRGGGQLVKDLIKTLGVEVGTEIGQAGGEAAVEKYTGVRPNANPIQEAIDVIGPTAFMTILTGGIAHAANRVDSKKPEEKEASQYIEKLKAGAMLSMDIDKGLITGELNGKPFSVQDAINGIRYGQDNGLYDNSDIDRFKNRYPQLRDALNGVIAENITKKVDEAVTNTVTNTIQNLSDVKLLPGGQGFELKGEPYQEGVTVGDPYGDVLRPVKRKSEDNVIDAEFSTVRRIEVPKREETKLLPGQGFELKGEPYQEGVTVGDPYGDVLRPVKRKSEDNVIDAEFNTVRRIEAPKKEETKLLPGQGFELSETDQDEISTLQERIQKVQNFLDKNEKHKGGKKYQQVLDRLEEDKARLAELTKGGEDNGTLRETETTVEEKPGETSAATPWFRGVDQVNKDTGDKFYSASNEVAGDFGEVSEMSTEEMPKNPLVVSSKEDLVDAIGYKHDPMAEPKNIPKEERFDVLAKKYAQDKGHDGIIYENGTLGERELHAFETETSHNKEAKAGPLSQMTTERVSEIVASTTDIDKLQKLKGRFEKTGDTEKLSIIDGRIAALEKIERESPMRREDVTSQETNIQSDQRDWQEMDEEEANAKFRGQAKIKRNKTTRENALWLQEKGVKLGEDFRKPADGTVNHISMITKDDNGYIQITVNNHNLERNTSSSKMVTVKVGDTVTSDMADNKPGTTRYKEAHDLSNKNAATVGVTKDEAKSGESVSKVPWEMTNEEIETEKNNIADRKAAEPTIEQEAWGLQARYWQKKGEKLPLNEAIAKVKKSREGFEEYKKNKEEEEAEWQRKYEEFKRSGLKKDSDILVKQAIADAKKNGPSPEFRALFGGIDPEKAGTTNEAVAKLAKDLGLEWRQPAAEQTKEPYEMTKEEWFNHQFNKFSKKIQNQIKNKEGNVAGIEEIRKQTDAQHKNIIKTAIAEGTITEHPDYPELRAASAPQNLTAVNVINDGFNKIKAKIGEKKAQEYFKQADKLINPNQNNIVEYRSNGIVTKDGNSYTFHALSGMDTNNWRIAFTNDITEQFTAPQIEAPEPKEIFIRAAEKRDLARVKKSLSEIPDKFGYEKVYQKKGKQGRGFYYVKMKVKEVKAEKQEPAISGAQNLITFLQRSGKVKLGEEFQDKTGDAWSRAHGFRAKDRSREMGDIAIVTSKNGKMAMDEAADLVNAEGFRDKNGDKFTDRTLFEALAAGEGRNILHPDKAERIIEKQIEEKENEYWSEREEEYLDQQREALAQEGIDAAREIEENSESVRADLISEIEAEGNLTEEQLEAAHDEISSFFDEMSKAEETPRTETTDAGEQHTLAGLSAAETFTLTANEPETPVVKGAKLTPKNLQPKEKAADMFAETAPEESLDEYRKSILPEYNTNKDIVALDAFVDSIRELNHKDDAVDISHGYKYTAEISYPHSLGEQGNKQTGLVYKDKPTIEEIKQDILDIYKEEKININKEVAMGIVAKSGRDEAIEEKIDNVLNAEPAVLDKHQYRMGTKSANDLINDKGLDYAKKFHQSKMEFISSANDKVKSYWKAYDDVIKKVEETKKTTPSNESVNKESATADSGEELKYNKRNRIRTGIKWEDISDKNTALKVKETNKQNVYPRPDYQQMIDDGVEPLIANIVKQVYDSIPIKPETRGIPTDEDLKLYITAVNRVMDGAIKWANDKNAIAAWAGKQAKTAGAMLGKVTSLSDLTEKDSKLLDFVYPEGYKSYLAEIRMLGGNKLLRALQPGYEHGKKALKEIQSGWPTKQESWQRQGLRIINGNELSTDTYTGKDNHDKPYTYAYINAKIDGRTIEIERRIFEGAESKDTPAVQEYLNSRKDFLKDKQILLDKRHKIIGDYNSLEEAQEAAREKVKRENKPTINEKGISVEQAERIGVARRLEGENISTDKLRETFGFRGVNFGNWMKGDTNETERQLHLNHAYDSFMDLAELLNVPPQALSLNGMLGVAFGAQGSGDKAAHFVPGVNEINLTRTAGAGTLVHEWAHALDHYFARMAGLEGSGEPFLTEHATQSPTRTAAEKQADGTWKKVTKNTFSENIRPEIVDLFKKIVNAMNNKEMAVTPEEQARELQTRLNKAKESVNGWLKAIRRDWFSGNEEAFDKLADRILNLDLGEGKVAASSTTYLSPVVSEIRELSKKTKGRNMPLDNIKSLQANIDHYEYLNSKKGEQHEPVMKRIDTEYSKNALKLDREKGGKPYWSQNLEKFARAFDAYISDTLEANAAKNTYLSHAGRSGETVPQGEERKTINGAIGKLIDEIKTRETDKGVEMYSVGEQGKYTMPTLKDVQDIFKGQEVKQFPNGAFLIRTKNGAEVIISAVDKITPSKISLSIGYSKTGISENEAIAGKYDKAMIDLVKGQADKWTLAHENIHWLEDIGVINDQEVRVLKRHISNLVNDGKWQTLNKDDIGGAEDRAEFLAQALQKEPRGLLGRIINKIQDFIDKIVNAFGVRTVRGITRDIKTGEIYGHETGAQREARLDLEGEMYAVKNKTKTPEFKKWFGASKVVDKNGDPLVVYKGMLRNDWRTGNEINEINSANGPWAGFFTSLKPVAKKFEEAFATMGEARTLEVYLSIKNPYIIDAHGKRAKEFMFDDTVFGNNPTNPGALAAFNKGYDGIIIKNTEDEGDVYIPQSPNQIKSATGNRGTFDQDNPDIQYSIRQQTDPPVSRDPKVLNTYLKDETDAIVQTIMNKLHPKIMSWLETMLKSPEWFDHPQIQNIVKLFMRDRNEIYHETFNDLNMTDDIDAPESTVTEAAKALRKNDPKGYERLKEILDEGDTAWKRSKNIPLAQQLKQFEDHIRKNPATTDEVIRVWKLYRQSYDKALDIMTKQLRDMIDQITEEARLKGETPDLSELKQTLKGALAEMEEWRGFYAPRLREPGNWVVQAYKEHGPLSGNKEWYRTHKGSELSAQREANRLKREGWTIHKIGEVEKIPETIYQDVNAVGTAKLIDAALEKLGKKSNLADDMVTKFNEEILREVSNAIKARGFRSTMIHRGRGSVVRGFVEDPIERHLMYINNISGGISKARVARLAMKELLGDKVMGKQVGGIDPVKDPKAFATAEDYIQEQLRNSEPVDRIIGLAKSIATFKFLGFNLRSLAVNTTAILTTAPAAIHQYVTGGKGSFTEIFRELAKAGKDYGAVMAGKDLGNPDEAAFIADVHKKGWDDAQYTREALGEISKTHSRIWSTMMDASMYLFGKSEKWNRGTTMLAAYRLARKQGLDHAQAAEAAKTSSDKAHGVYGKSTMPMWAQGTNPAAKIGQMMYVYSKFGHNYLQMLYDMGFKQHNIKGAMFAFLSPLVLAGGAAMPFKDAIFGLASVILGLLGYDDDPEKWVWDEIREHLGMGAEKVGRHGLTGAMGVDISGSLSIGVGIPKNFIDLTGAIGGVGTEIKEAGENLGRGNVGRAAEHLLPTGLSNPLRAMREAEEGVSTRNNRRVWDEKGRPYVPGIGESVSRSLGFRSTDQAVLSERTWEGHKQQTAFAEKRNRIYERYRAWLLGGRDREEYKKIVKEVQDFNAYIRRNKIRGESFITSESLRNQVRRMQKPSRKERSILEE